MRPQRRSAARSNSIMHELHMAGELDGAEMADEEWEGELGAVLEDPDFDRHSVSLKYRNSELGGV